MTEGDPRPNHNEASAQDPASGAARKLPVQRVLVVCVGNICRSPIAEILLQHRLGDSRIVVESAGVAAVVGSRIEPLAAQVLQRHHLDGGGHVARQLNREMLDTADLVLAMERSQIAFIRAFSPAATGKTFLLGKWQAESEIPDPYGKSPADFEQVYHLIERAVHRWRALI